MWFLGFSTANSRSYWIIGAIILVIILTIILRKLAVYLASQDDKSSDEEDDQCLDIDQTNKIEARNDCMISSCPSSAIRTYALDELKVATNDFRIRIGVGATSYVYLAELGDGKFGAVKRVMEERGGSQKMFLDEVSVLLRIRHPNLVGLMGFCLEKGEQLLLLEYVPNKSLFDRMHTFQGQSSGILSWLADPAVIHRDIKSSNILLIDDNHAKLADFGLCKLGNDAQSAHTPTAVRGSLGYVDTNYLNTGIVSPKSDVYSYGVLLLELITGLRSVQGSFTLPEWTEDCRKSDNVEVLVGMLDPKLNGDVNLEQLRVLIDIANLALLANSEARPDMTQIAYRIYSCMEIQPQPELPV
ncbi:Protein kinase superfamily protein [Forsythia ovata]|uniref:non-specific serine/threonine protein kinase n=1 Tax=Forsythia ovata TaxID=205694 RepID=A0ABD1RN48_9LAMI